MKNKIRLDQLLVQQGLAPSRESAKRLIMSGAVSIDNSPATKPGKEFPVETKPQLAQGRRFVSRGGEKIEPALLHFGINTQGITVIDLGSSTGGFTDCLLQRGARHSYAVDVGYGQLDLSLREDERVTVMEKVNARNLEANDFPEPADLVTIDVSFISLKLVLPAANKIVKEGGHILALIKPQFEAGPENNRKGVVRCPQVHAQVKEDITRFAAEELGLESLGVETSQLPGPKGNIEFFILLQKGNN